jgi:hypothetical protein
LGAKACPTKWICWEHIREEFFSKLVFDRQLHQVGNAPSSFATLGGQSRHTFSSLEKNTQNLGQANSKTSGLMPDVLRVLVGFWSLPSSELSRGFANIRFADSRESLLLSLFGELFVYKVLDGTTACEKPLLQINFCFEHFFYSSAILIL